MIKFFNAVLIAAVLASATVMYSLEHSTRALERETADIRRQIEDKKEGFKLLNAEWSSLTRPERIEQLARKYLGLVPAKAVQFVDRESLARELTGRAHANETASIENLLQEKP